MIFSFTLTLCFAITFVILDVKWNFECICFCVLWFFFKINFFKSILPSHQTRILGLKKETVSYYVANAYKLLIAHVTLIGWLFTNIFYLLFNTWDWSGTASYDFLPCSVILIPTIFTEVHLIHITENSHKIQKVQRASAVIHQQDTSIKIKWVVIYPA